MARKEQLALLKRRKRARARHPSTAVNGRQPQPAHALQRVVSGRASSADVLTLQRSLGNAVVQRVLADRGYAAGLMRMGDGAAAAVQSPARQRLQELSEVDIGKPGERSAWSASPAMTAIMVIVMEMAKTVDDLEPARVEATVLQWDEMLQQAKETADRMEDPDEKEAAQSLLAAAAAIATAVLAVARLTGRIQPRQLRLLARALSAYDPMPAKLFFVEAGKSAQTEAELVGLSELVGTAQKDFESKLEKARSQYEGDDALLKRLLGQFQQDAADALNPAAWRIQ
ncbi:MAG: hypothetical protein R3300_05965 [Candidatus Promineifilaceae bacterium]|nr:hypothetical protein [Candidatus Promineifilaceae bacterium]